MAKQFKKKKDEVPEPRINDELYGNYEVRVVYPDGDKYESKLMSLNEAKRMADNMDLDLIEINNSARPNILRIDNYSKWLYNEKRKAKENKQKKVELKEIQLTTNIGKNDIETKARHCREFIENGDKVKVVLTMKKRELTRREESKRCLYEFIVLVSDVAVPESLPKDEGVKSVVILKKKK